jgi:hypothetical protein
VLWLRSLDEQLCLFGGNALYAYELETETLAPKELTRDERLSFMFVGDAPIQLDDILDAIEDATRQPARTVEQQERFVVQFGTIEVEFIDPAFVARQAADADQTEVLAEALHMPLVKGLTVARDAQAVEITTLDPRAYALAAHVLGGDDEIWAERARFTAALVRERWPEQFDPRQEAAFPGLCGDPEYQRGYHWP